MKFNQWTLGLAAVGAVSLASAVRADEAPKLSAVQTALSNTTISGYVDVGANYTFGNQSTDYYQSGPKADRFTLNDVLVSLDKPLDETPWASGYHIDVNTGADAVYGSSGYVRQAYVALRTPVGNGIDWKFGVMDGITGYEGNSSILNPNISYSYGWNFNPATYTGLLGTYKVSDIISVTAGMINPTYGLHTLSSKSYVGAVAITAPDSWGFLKGSTWNFQTIQSFESGGVNNYSANGTISTPVAGLKVGVSYDYIQNLAQGYSYGDGAVYGVYATYQATDKLGLSLRGEYVDGRYYPGTGFDLDAGSGSELTATLSYNLWANVVSRVEFRWDHIDHSDSGEYGIHGNGQDLLGLTLSVAYKF
jgi:Putative beta-barrel porin-2, OmpL-like. bbp2